MTQTFRTFPLGGGLDLTSAALAVPAGRVIASSNYEPLAEGYGRVAGNERFDGHPAPSEAVFATLAFVNGGIPIAADDTIVGGTSGASASVIVDPYGVSGSWDDNTATGLLVLALVTGTFTPGELLKVGGIAHANGSGLLTLDSAPTADLREAWTIEAQEARRAVIGKVPGEGPVRGVAVLLGTVYAWRNVVGGAGAAMWKATATGWQAINPSRRLDFTNGANAIEEGDAISQLGVIATVHRVVIKSGTFAAGTAKGFLVITGQTGTFAAGDIFIGATRVGTLAGPSSAIQFPAGGRYSTLGHNFYGAANRYRLYGVNGVGQAFEYDGNVVVPISTGMTFDTPTRIAEVSQHLLLAFPGGSLQYSGTGEPNVWEVILGAGEIGLGTEITDIVQAAETAVVVFGKNKVATLQGRDSESFQLDELTEEAGADPWTAQRIGTTVYLDNRGLRTLAATQAYGNFKTGTLTEVIAPYFRAKQKIGVTAVASLVCKSKSHYRLFWSDGTGLTVYMGRKVAESMPFTLGDMQPFCATVGEMGDGSEGMFVGAEDGYVYRLDSGPSFDGDAVRAFAMLPFNHIGTIMQNKRFNKVSLEMVAQPATRIGLTAQYDYADGVQPPDLAQTFTVAGGGGAWGQLDWGGFYWSAPLEGTAEAYIDGFGRNVSVLIGAQSGPAEDPHILQAYSIHYAPRGLKR